MKRIRAYSYFLLLFFPLLAHAATDAVFKDFSGKDRRLSEFIGRGKWTIVTFWAHDCPICKQEIHQMVFFHDAHRKKDAIVLGVSVDGYSNRGKAQQFIDDQALNFTNLITDPETVGRLGGGAFIGTPTYYLYDPEGRLAGKNVGPLTQEEVEAFIKSRGKRGSK